MRTASITIHQNSIKHNVKVLKNLAPKSRFLAMIKANAYGHGVEAVIPALSVADALGVATMTEALQAQEVLKQERMSKVVVLIEGVFDELEWQMACDRQMQALIHCQAQLEWACNAPPDANNPTNTVWLKYNTGMNRLGFDKQAVLVAAKRLIDAGFMLILTSHFACADDKNHPMNAKQISAFDEVYTQLKHQFGDKIHASLCNSAGILNFKHAHYDWVRSGIAMYGSSPIEYTAKELSLKPAMTLSAQIMVIHALKAQEGVGYGTLWATTHSQCIAIVSLGYGDGYPRVVENAWVGVVHEGVLWRAPIVGRVAMDMIAIDIDKLPSDVGVGASVIFWGDAERFDCAPSVDEIAACAHTIGYELLCRLTTRPTRIAAI